MSVRRWSNGHGAGWCGEPRCVNSTSVPIILRETCDFFFLMIAKVLHSFLATDNCQRIVGDIRFSNAIIRAQARGVTTANIVESTQCRARLRAAG
jgi:hypothetical protein